MDRSLLGNSVVAETVGAQVDSFTRDSTNPILVSYSVNMNTRRITFEFDEPASRLGVFVYDAAVEWVCLCVLRIFYSNCLFYISKEVRQFDRRRHR